jgi:hypothetical protein
MEPLRKPLALGDIFDRTFSVIGKTFLRNLCIGIIVLAPAAYILSIGTQAYFSAISEMVSHFPQTKTSIHAQQGTENKEPQQDDEASESSPQEEPAVSNQPKTPEDTMNAVRPMLSAFGLAGLAYLFFVCASISSRALCSRIICKEFDGEQLSWNEIFTSGSLRMIFKSLGQVFLEALVYIGTMVIVTILAVVCVFFGKIGIVFMVLIIVSSLALMLFFNIRWTFTVVTIVNEDVGAMQSFVRSTSLVKDHWWRTLGITMLLGFIIMFGISLIVTPVGFYLMWDFYSAYFKSLGAPAPDPMQSIKLLGSLGWGFGIMIAVDALLKLLVEPAYKCAMYFDLRARHNEFEPKPESPMNALFHSKNLPQ